MNLREIETLRTKEELVNYFKERGQSITEEEIEALKKSYEQAEEANGVLSLEQPGGVFFRCEATRCTYETCDCNTHKRISYIF